MSEGAPTSKWTGWGIYNNNNCMYARESESHMFSKWLIFRVFPRESESRELLPQKTKKKLVFQDYGTCRYECVGVISMQNGVKIN